MGNGLVECVRADTDRGPAEVVLADVHRVERGVPSFAVAVQNISFAYRVVAQLKLGHVVLARNHVLHEVVVRVLGIRGKEDVFIALFHPAEGRHDGSFVSISDVVLATVREPTVAILREHHVG